MNGVVILPETAHIRNLIIKNHEVQLPLGLFNWLKINIKDHKTIIPRMEEQGIEWYGVAEYMATELERDYNIAWGLYLMSPSGMSIDECKKIGKTGPGQKIIKDVIHAIRNCDTYMDFKDTFEDTFEYESKFVQSIKERLKGEFT